MWRHEFFSTEAHKYTAIRKKDFLVAISSPILPWKK
jgi:hypothetical protein